MNIRKLVRENILRLKPYSSARGKYLNGILLDANENAIGSVIDQRGELNLNRYPDPNHNEVKEKLSKYINIPNENLFIGVGSDEIIDLLVRIFCNPSVDNCIINEPTYGMYKVVCDINDVECKSVLLTENFQLDLEKIKSVIDEKTKIIFICSPNNPTANLLKKDHILNLAKKTDTVVVVDEAYVDFSSQTSLMYESLNHENLVVMRTFSKAWGLAGIRAGYCTASKEITEILYKIKAPYNLNSLTSQSIISAIDLSGLKDKFVNDILIERERVENELKNINGIKQVFESETNYLFFFFYNAKGVYNKLAEKGVIIRDRSNQPLLENCLRVSIGTKDHNDKFLKELREVL